ISILAAILFPVFARARENARRTSCLSNLKQIGLGIMQYVQDYDETYPLTHYDRTPGDSTTRYYWWSMLQPYIKSTQVFSCPSSAFSDGTANGNYGANREVIPLTPNPIKMATLQSTANIYMVM